MSNDAGTESSTDAASPVTADQAAGDAAAALCARFAACAPLYITVYGGVATCTARLKQSVIQSLAVTNTSTTAAQIEACALAIPSASCADLLSHNLPDVCHAKPGTLADGTPCGEDGQCVGARCRVPKNGTCGVCGTHTLVSGGCGVDDDCVPGLSCVNQTCMKLGAAGDACDTNRPCRADFGCTNGVCAAPKTAGQACATMPDNCDNLNAVLCNGRTNVCDKLTFAATGAMCGLVANSFVACAGAGATCKGIMAPNYQGICVAGAADGAACDDANGPKCQPPAVCSAGTCVLANPATCK